MRLDEGIAFEASVVAELREVAASDWVFVDQTASPGLQVEATTWRPRRPGMRPGRLRGGRRQAPSYYRRRRRCPVDVDTGRTNTDRRRSRRWLGAASQQSRLLGAPGPSS